MARLIVKLDGHELGAFALGEHPLSIGRLPDNHIVIDSPAVSSRHARVSPEGPLFVLEDLKSTNGTFVNGKPVARHTLREGDVVVVGKHSLLFVQDDADQAEAAGAHQAGVVDLPHVYDDAGLKTAIPTAHGKIGIVKVLEGDTGQSEYTLTAMTTLIGKADQAQIRLKGWRAPQLVAAISRKGAGFTISPMGGLVVVNGELLSRSRDLASGDVIETSGVTLVFALK